MSYIKAEDYLPVEVIELIQEYVEGKNIYIPKKKHNRLPWGSKTQTKQNLLIRDQEIFADYLLGKKINDLANKYFLSEKSIQRIIRKMKHYFDSTNDL